MSRATRRHQKKPARKAAKQQSGRAPQALDRDEKALLELVRRGIRAHQSGRVQEAARTYQQVLEADPNHADANHLLGVLFSQLGRPAEAVDLISKAIDRAPKIPTFHNNLGNALRDLGCLDKAVASYQRALAVKPDYAGAHYNLGRVLRELGRKHDAVASYRKAIAIKPSYVEAHRGLGVAFQDLRRPDDALSCLRRAVALDPRDDRSWTALAECLMEVSFTAADSTLLHELLRLLDRPTSHPHVLARPIISALRHHPEVSRLLELTGPGGRTPEIDYADEAERLGSIPLLLRIMELSPINDLELEDLLAVLRHAMICATLAGTRNEKDLRFSVALALQCFINEYVLAESAQETMAVEQLQDRTAKLVEDGQAPGPALVAALGAYRPLHRFSWSHRLLEWERPGEIEKVIAQQITEPKEERSLRSRIPRLTIIKDAVSQAVRGQYEENPYPRRIRSAKTVKRETWSQFIKRLPPSPNLSVHDPPERPDILVAGCGTGRHALHAASRFANARVLAVDLSLSSLAFAMRKARELGVSNIEFAQGDIMELDGLERDFDVIECVGVLHHLRDPLAGWRILADLLRSGGHMKVGLYSEVARRDVVAARGLIGEAGYEPTSEDIRRCRRHIRAMAEDGDLAMSKVCARQSFFTMSECRDLLFHVQEQRFTLPLIQDALKALELEFLGFELEDRRILRAFEDTHPDLGALISLPLWHEFEQEHPDTFRGMYQFWCRRCRA